jgi:pSer/pThr/pTyr-binding forkhead associated (FHA) protein
LNRQVTKARRECDIVIPDRQVAASTPACGGSGFEVEDLGSKNGTHVNGTPVLDRVPQDSDLIQVALVRQLVFVGFDSTGR